MERENLSSEHAESLQDFATANILSTVTREPTDIKKKQHQGQDIMHSPSYMLS